jgi:uncharacterized membrane protein
MTELHRRDLPGYQAVQVRRLTPWAGVLGGAALLALGAARRDGWAAGAGAGLAGASVIYRLAVGDRPLAEKLGLTSTKGKRPATSVAYHRGLKVEQAVTIQKPAEDLYRFWRQLTNLPHFMRHLESVDLLDQGQSYWTAKGPAGLRVSWKAEIVNEVPNEVIGWRSLPGSDVDNAGSVRFRELPQDRGTEVRVTLKYDPPAGKAGILIAKLFGRDAQAEVREDLRRLKALLEAGEAPTTAGQPAGSRSPLAVRLPRPPRRFRPPEPELQATPAS